MPKVCCLCFRKGHAPMHRFPNPERFPELFKAWVHVAGGKLETAAEYDFYKKKIVCDNHFTDHVKTRNKRLSALAIPSRRLPGSSKNLMNVSVVVNETNLTLASDTGSSTNLLMNVSVMANETGLTVTSDTGACPMPTALDQTPLNSSRINNMDLQFCTGEFRSDMPAVNVMLEHNYSNFIKNRTRIVREMDPAERKRQSRAKQMEDPEKRKEILQKEKDPEKRKEILQKEKERSRRRRLIAKEKITQNPELGKLLKEKERIKKRRYRENKKAEKTLNTDSELGSYKSKRTLQKAVKKTMQSMPESPIKRDAVVRKIVKNILPSLALFSVETKRQRSDVISAEDKKRASNFYEQDDISRVAPGRKDTISVKDPITGKRTHVAKRHMNMSVAEAYQLFREKYPEAKIGKSKFFEFRPVHVRPMNEMPHNVCVCPYHANFNYMVETLHKTVANIPQTTTELLQEITCDIRSEKCMTGHCTNCFDVHDIVNLKVDMESIKVVWKQWKKTDNHYVIATASGTLKELLEEINKQTAKFKTHVFIKDQQSGHFEKRKHKTS